MSTAFGTILDRAFDPGQTSEALRNQWLNPGDVFSVLLILGGDVIGRALAQLVGSRLTPVAFSFGWVAYSITAVMGAFGENRLMPPPDFSCQVVNGRNGYARNNASWIIGRIMRDFDYWKDSCSSNGPIDSCLQSILDERWKKDKKDAEKQAPGSGQDVPRPRKAGLCVSIFKAGPGSRGYPGYDSVYWAGYVTSVIQLGIAAIPCGLYGDWGSLLITTAGICLSFASGSLHRWTEEKWACRQDTLKSVILTRGNGSQHAIVVLGGDGSFDLEDLAGFQVEGHQAASFATKICTIALAGFWMVLLISAAGLKEHSWFLLAIGCIGIIENVFVAGKQRRPEAFGMPLIFEDVIGHYKVMGALFAVEEQYPRIGRSMRDIHFPGRLRPDEIERWSKLEEKADALDRAAAQRT